MPYLKFNLHKGGIAMSVWTLLVLIVGGLRRQASSLCIRNALPGIQSDTR
ncbi:GlyGly-CTERM sorting domain-containing protein [Mailhella sp.]